MLRNNDSNDKNSSDDNVVDLRNYDIERLARQSGVLK
jgi:hypothetical protein